MTFDAFNLHEILSANLKSLNISIPTKIQAEAIPVVLDGKDVMGIAQTGTGKTAAFLLPIMQRLLTSKSEKVRALVLAPTRELAEQIKEVAVNLCKGSNVRVAAIYGGVSMIPQMKNLRQNCELVIACPGRLLDHIQRRNVDLRGIEMLVLDEADQMFDMGFLPTLKQILQQLPKNRQSLLFSATMPDEIRKLTQEILKDPVTVQIGERAPTSTVEHALYPVPQHLKSNLLIQILRTLPCESVLVFTRTKHQASKLETILQREKFQVTALHGNLSQAKRQISMKGFRSGKYQILVATDIAARGVDISSISHVINYDMPATTETYTHRIGRTGRAQKTGDAFTFSTRADEYMIRQIERVLKTRIERKTIEGFDYKAEAPAREKNAGSDRRDSRRGDSRRDESPRYSRRGREEGRRPQRVDSAVEARDGRREDFDGGEARSRNFRQGSTRRDDNRRNDSAGSEQRSKFRRDPGNRERPFRGQTEQRDFRPNQANSTIDQSEQHSQRFYIERSESRAASESRKDGSPRSNYSRLGGEQRKPNGSDRSYNGNSERGHSQQRSTARSDNRGPRNETRGRFNKNRRDSARGQFPRSNNSGRYSDNRA